MGSPIQTRIENLNAHIQLADSWIGVTGDKVKALETINNEIKNIFDDVISKSSGLSKDEKITILTSLRVSVDNASKIAPKGIAASFPKLFPNQHEAIASLKKSVTTLTTSIDTALKETSVKSKPYGTSTTFNKKSIIGDLAKNIEKLASKLKNPAITDVGADLEVISTNFSSIYEIITALDSQADQTNNSSLKISQETAEAAMKNARDILKFGDTGLNMDSKFALAQAKEEARELLELLESRIPK